MPASMPDATDDGIREISLVSGLSTPVRMSSTATTMKAPTASPIVKPELTPTSAAPGVDHAAIIGMRVRQLSHAVSARLRQADRRHPARGLVGRRPDRLGGGDDQRQRTAQADNRRDERRNRDRQPHA